MKMQHNSSIEVSNDIFYNDLISKVQTLVGFGPVSLFYQDTRVTDQNYREFLQSKTIFVVRRG